MQASLDRFFLLFELFSSSSSEEDDDDIPLRLNRRRRQRRRKIENYIEDVVNYYTEKQFRENFRVSRETVNKLVELFEESEFFPNDHRRKSAEEHILAFIWYAANKSTLRSVSERFNMAISTLFIVNDRGSAESTNTAVVLRGGLSAQDYLIEFLLFLKKRTCGFNPNCFQTNDELNRTLSTLEYYRIPKNLWIGLLNGCLRIIAQFIDIVDLTIEKFVEILMDVINVFVYFAIDYFFLKAALFIIGLLTQQYLQVITRALYFFITWAGRKIWELVRPKIERYSVFVLKQITSTDS